MNDDQCFCEQFVSNVAELRIAGTECCVTPRTPTRKSGAGTRTARGRCAVSTRGTGLLRQYLNEAGLVREGNHGAVCAGDGLLSHLEVGVASAH